MPAANPSAAAGHGKPGFGAGDRIERQIARPPAASRRLLSFQQHDLGDADAGSDLARQRQSERLARPAARQPIEHGQRQRPPRRKRLIRRARQHDDGRVADAADGRGAAGLQRDAMGDDFAALGQARSPSHRCGRRRCRRRSAADRRRRHRALRDRRGIAACGRRCERCRRRRLRALSAIRSAVMLHRRGY